MSNWYRLEKNGDLSLRLYVQPGSKKTAVAGYFAEALKIRLAALPVEGQANAALLTFLAKILKLPKSRICLQRGQSCRHKEVRISHCTQEELHQLLNSLNPEQGRENDDTCKTATQHSG